jgi:hypothetical protein
MYYKVVSQVGTQLHSAMHEQLPKSWVVEYIPGEWVLPKIGRLMVFDTIEAARRFLTRGSEQIWECEATDTKYIRLVVSVWLSPQSFGYWARKLWAGFAISYTVHGTAPQGGVSATAVKLTRRIE